ncbi:hypothetical protein CMV_028031, partial [Castanea mollissima]
GPGVVVSDGCWYLLDELDCSLVTIMMWDISQTERLDSEDVSGLIKEWPSKKDIGHMFEFIPYYVACKRANVSRSVMSQILEYLTSQNNFPTSVSSHHITSTRREKQVLALLEVMPEIDWNASSILGLSEKAQFYQVCGFIHTIRHDDNERAIFQSAIISRTPELVDLSREGTFLSFIGHFNKEGLHIPSELCSHPRSLFLYLKTVIEVYLSGTLNFSSLRRDDFVDPSDGIRLD